MGCKFSGSKEPKLSPYRGIGTEKSGDGESIRVGTRRYLRAGSLDRKTTPKKCKVRVVAGTGSHRSVVHGYRCRGRRKRVGHRRVT